MGQCVVGLRKVKRVTKNTKSNSFRLDQWWDSMGFLRYFPNSYSELQYIGDSESISSSSHSESDSDTPSQPPQPFLDKVLPPHRAIGKITKKTWKTNMRNMARANGSLERRNPTTCAQQLRRNANNVVVLLVKNYHQPARMS
jgi:hypothetical protein